MPRSAKSTKGRILASAYKLFYKDGFSRVSMDDIAASAEVTKRTLYNHFDSKDSLAAAVLEDQHLHALARIQEWGRCAAECPKDYLAAIFAELEAWARKPRWHGSGFTRLTMELADLPGHPVRRAAHHHKAAVEAWLAEDLARLGVGEAEALAREVMLLIEGALSLALIHSDGSYVVAAGEAARRLLSQSDTDDIQR